MKSTWKAYIVLFVVALILSASFLFASSHEYRLGYPLDDAWIHQTFARNLVEYGNWSYNPGELAAGSTSPFWTILISLGYLIGINPYAWTYLLGILALALVGCLSLNYLQSIQSKIWLSMVVSVLIMGEWHLVWSAVSGMEILLITLLPMAVFLCIYQPSPRWWIIGILIGASIWVRPDGITLLAPVLWIWLWSHRKQNAGSTISKVFLPVIFLTIIYLFFNYQISGSILPNTFYAKQNEYAELLSLPILIRLGNMAKTILAGPGIIWTVGFLAGIVFSFKEKKYTNLAPYLWVMGYLILYAARLPVYYQHGRYLMPILGVMMLFSVLPLLKMAQNIKTGMISFIVSRVFAVTLCLVTLIFLFIGAQAYAKDTAIIEKQMVTTAKWVADNTPDDAIIAAHDIGALGYFGDRKILDLAGLITPEVIPFIRDSRKLASYILDMEADYLIVFPTWYNPPIDVPGRVVLRAGGEGSNNDIFENLEVIEIQ